VTEGELSAVVTRLLTNREARVSLSLMHILSRLTIPFLLIALTAAVAQQPAPKPADPPKAAAAAPPSIPLELRAKFFKAQSENLQASQAMEKAAEALPQYAISKAKSDALQGVINLLVKACGNDFQPSLSSDEKNPETAGDPICIAKPSAPAPQKPAGK
jgi:hypothetical protein